MKHSDPSSVGDFVAVPLPHGGFGFARSMDPLMGFYMLRSSHMLGVEEIRSAPIAFIASVHTSWRKRWRRIGKLPLELLLRNPVDFLKKDILTGVVSVYTRFPGDRKRSEQRPATHDDCLHLDPLGSWDPEQVENWLDLVLDGKEFPLLENIRAKTLSSH